MPLMKNTLQSQFLELKPGIFLPVIRWYSSCQSLLQCFLWGKLRIWSDRRSIRDLLLHYDLWVSVRPKIPLHVLTAFFLTPDLIFFGLKSQSEGQPTQLKFSVIFPASPSKYRDRILFKTDRCCFCQCVLNKSFWSLLPPVTIVCEVYNNSINKERTRRLRLSSSLLLHISKVLVSNLDP
jgi:hypothetical protein